MMAPKTLNYRDAPGSINFDAGNFCFRSLYQGWTKTEYFCDEAVELSQYVGGPANKESWRDRFPLKEDAFSLLTPEAAYWVGFLMADGSVSDKSKISLKLGKKANCTYWIYTEE